MTTLLITGTRILPVDGRWELEEWLCRQEYDVLLCGGAKGTDFIAADMAREMGKAVIEVKPDYAKYGAKAAPVLRNEALAKEAKRRNARVVAWQPCERTNGTQDTINRCLAHGNTVEVYEGNGNWKTYNEQQLSLL